MYCLGGYYLGLGIGILGLRKSLRVKFLGCNLRFIFIAQFFMSSSLNRIRPLSLMVWILGGFGKKEKKIRKILIIKISVFDRY